MQLGSFRKYLSWLRSACRVSLLITFFVCGISATQSAYANTLIQSHYRSFAGDVNGDGQTDVLLKATSVTVMISVDDDLSFPVIVHPKNPTFALLSNSNGTYSLSINSSAIQALSSVWQPNSHELVYGDVLGNGFGSVLIRTKSPGAPSFVVASTSLGTLQLIQQLTASSIGIDLGAAGTTAVLQDNNSDGRTDLVVHMDDRIAAIFIADQNGVFRRDDEASIQAVWSGLLNAFRGGDPTKASQYLIDESRELYRQAFTDLGPELPNIPAAISSIRALSKGNQYSEYLFTQNIGGESTMHIVTFVRRSGVWSINGF